MSNKPKQPRCPICGKFMANITWLTPYVVTAENELLFGCHECWFDRSISSSRFFVRDKWNDTKWYEKDSIPVRRTPNTKNN